MRDADSVIFLDVFDVQASADWWNALAGYKEVHREQHGDIGERVRLRSPIVPALDLDLHTCKPRPPVGCTLGSIRQIALRVPNPHAAVAGLVAKLGPAALVEVARTDSSITIREGNGYQVLLETSAVAHRPAGSA